MFWNIFRIVNNEINLVSWLVWWKSVASLIF